jgi:hypothetical protein
VKVKPIKTIAPDGRDLSLTLEREYEVLGIEADDYRILNDPETWPYGNDPVLFEPECFEITDHTVPAFWVCSTGVDGEQYCYPPEWNEVGFFEDYHERVESVRKQFWEDLKRYYPQTWQARAIETE